MERESRFLCDGFLYSGFMGSGDLVFFVKLEKILTMTHVGVT